MSLLDGKVAIVTGAAQGIGASLAAGLAAEGAKLVISDVLDGAEIAAQIKRQGGAAVSLITDITDSKSCEDMVSLAASQFGGVDILVNNAALFGKLPLTSLMEISEEDWDRVMQVNTRAVWQCTKAVVPAMAKRGGGSIVNIATNRVFKGYPNLLHYDASKGAVMAMNKAMAMELGAHKIRVNAVAPGLTMSENVLAKEGIQERSVAVVNDRALKRQQQPEDLIGPVLFFASDLSGFVTGQSLIADGGGIMQ